MERGKGKGRRRLGHLGLGNETQDWSKREEGMGEKGG